MLHYQGTMISAPVYRGQLYNKFPKTVIIYKTVEYKTKTLHTDYQFDAI